MSRERSTTPWSTRAFGRSGPPTSSPTGAECHKLTSDDSLRRHEMKTKTLLALTLGALLIPSCGKKADLPAINVGLIAELTGDLSAFGASCKNAAELKVAEIGDKGGIDIGGKK